MKMDKSNARKQGKDILHKSELIGYSCKLSITLKKFRGHERLNVRCTKQMICPFPQQPNNFNN